MLAAYLLVLIEIKHFRDDEEIVIILFHLRTLARVEHVFQGQRVQIETLPEDAQNAQVTQAVDVDPGDKLIAEMREELITADVLSFLKTVRSILDEGDDRRFLRRILREFEQPRGLAGHYVTSSFEHPASCSRGPSRASMKQTGRREGMMRLGERSPTISNSFLQRVIKRFLEIKAS